MLSGTKRWKVLDWETLKSSEIVKVYNNLNHNTQIQMCISTVQYMLCKVELPGKYSYFPKVCKAIQMYAQQQRVLTSRPLQVWSQLMRKVLTIYGLSPTQQTAPTELLLDFQRSIYGLNRHNSKLPRNSCRISDNAVMVLQPHNSKLPRNLCRIFNNVLKHKYQTLTLNHTWTWSLCGNKMKSNKCNSTQQWEGLIT